METQSIVEKFIIEELMVAPPDTKLDPDESLISSGVIDSLAILRLIAFVEDTFGVTVADEDVVPENFETARIITEFIQARK